MESKVHFIDNSLMLATLSGYDHNPLARWLTKLFGRFLPRESVEDELRRYCVGTCRHAGGATVLWQVDTLGRVRSGCIENYHPVTGERITRTAESQSLVHTLLRDRFPSFVYHPCYFGSHLLGGDSADSRVLMFESGKEALLTALAARAVGEGMEELVTPIACDDIPVDFPEHDRLSSVSPLRALRDRCVNIMPCRGNFVRWSMLARKVPEQYASVRVSSLMEPTICPSWLLSGCKIEARESYEDVIVSLLNDPACGREQLALLLLAMYAGGRSSTIPLG